MRGTNPVPVQIMMTTQVFFTWYFCGGKNLNFYDSLPYLRLSAHTVHLTHRVITIQSHKDLTKVVVSVWGADTLPC